MQGRIIKGIAGFYYVDTVESGVYECRARGIFRKEGKKPLVGDYVRISVLDTEEREGSLDEILPRKNELMRPAVANIDQALIFFAMSHPKPNYLLLDRFLLSVAREGIPAILCFNKSDLAAEEEIGIVRDIYRGCGASLHFVSVRTGEGINGLREELKGRVTALGGPSGAGKSSFTNALQSGIRMETGEISKKLARGKNTTRHSELIPVEDNTYILDTPGFTALDTAPLAKEELDGYYPELTPYRKECYFSPCSHVHEPGCRVREAVEEGMIHTLRYEGYCRIYEELQEAEKRQYR